MIIISFLQYCYYCYYYYYYYFTVPHTWANTKAKGKGKDSFKREGDKNQTNEKTQKGPIGQQIGHSNTDLQEKTVLIPEHDGIHVIIIIIIIIITSSSSSPSSLCIIMINLTDGSGCFFLIIALFSIQSTFSLLFGVF